MNLKSIALVDLSYLFKKNWHAAARDAKPGWAAQSTLDQIAGVRGSVDHVIICCDAPPYRRVEVDPNYKAQREKPDDAEISQKKWLMDRLDKGGYSIAKVKGYEADDVIGTLAKAYASSGCADVRIIANDKDCAQCVSDVVRMFVPAVGSREAEVRGPKEILAKYGVEPKDMALWLALTGDSSDNIPGVPGIGEKKAAALITDHKSLAGIAEALSALVAEGKPLPAMWKSLAEHWTALVASLKLSVLEEVPIDAVALLVKREVQSLSGIEGMKSEDNITDAEWDPISKPKTASAPASPAPSSPIPPPAVPVPQTTALTRYGVV